MYQKVSGWLLAFVLAAPFGTVLADGGSNRYESNSRLGSFHELIEANQFVQTIA